jgi:tetratricopeptide (TPR) repeat protein
MQNLTLNPKDADAHYQLGLSHFERGNHQTARDYFRNALEIEPDDPDYHYSMGRLLEAETDWAGALQQYEEVYRLDPSYKLGDILREVGKGYLKTGEVEKALEFLKYFVNSRESDPEGRYWLAVALGRSGDPAAMRTHLNRLLDEARSNPRFFRKEKREWLYRARVRLKRS